MAAIFCDRGGAGDVAGDNEVRCVGGEGLVRAQGEVHGDRVCVRRIVDDAACSDGESAASEGEGACGVVRKGEGLDAVGPGIVCAGAVGARVFDLETVDCGKAV